MFKISLDRLFAVSWPLVYFEMGRRYALGLVTFVSVYSCVSGTAAWIYPLAYSGPATISPLCINRLAYGPFQSYLNLIRVLFAYGSVIVYLLVNTINVFHFTEVLTENNLKQKLAE